MCGGILKGWKGIMRLLEEGEGSLKGVLGGVQGYGRE